MRVSRTMEADSRLRPTNVRIVWSGATTLTRALLACGALYALFFVVINDVVAVRHHPGYSRATQAISELSATGAPAARLLTATMPIAIALLIAFGGGVWRSAHGSQSLRAAAALLVAHAATFPLWTLAPMTARDDMVGPMGPNDVGHMVLTAMTLMFILLEIGFGASALGGRFRRYSQVTAIAVVGFGVLTALQSAQLPHGPTPLLGVLERASIGAWLIWLVALAVALLRREARR